MTTAAKLVASKTTRLMAGYYLYETCGRRYVLKDERTREGLMCRPLWRVCHLPDGRDPWCPPVSFDVCKTLREARAVAEDDAAYRAAAAAE